MCTFIFKETLRIFMNFTYILFSLIKLLGGRSKIRRSKFTTDSSNTIPEVCKLFKFSYVLI